MATVASPPAPPTTRTVTQPGPGASTPDTAHDAGATAGSEPTVSPAEKPIKKKRKTYDDAMLLKHLPSLQEAMTKAAFVPSRRNAARNLHHMMYVYKNWAATVWPKMSSSEFFSKTAEFKHRLRNHIKDLRDKELVRAHRSNMAADDIRAEEEAEAAAAAAAAGAAAETAATDASRPFATATSAAATRKRPQTGGEEPMKKSPALGPKSQNRTAGTASVVDDDDEFGIEAFDFDDDDLDASGTFAKSGSARADLPTEEDLAAAEEAEMAGFEDDLEAMMELEDEVTSRPPPVLHTSSTPIPATSKKDRFPKPNSTGESVGKEAAHQNGDAVPAMPSNVSSVGTKSETPDVGAGDRPASTVIVEASNSIQKKPSPQTQLVNIETTGNDSSEIAASQVVEQAPTEGQNSTTTESGQRDDTSSETVSTAAKTIEEPKA